MDLSRKTVVVTGAGRGLGRAYAIDCATAGARVVVNDRDEDEAAIVAQTIRERHGDAAVSGHDVRDRAAVAELMSFAVDRFGALDGVVVNAGVYHEAMPWDEDATAVASAVAVNVLGGLHCVQEAGRIMAEARAGSIVIASSAGALGSRAIATYAATKGALASLMYSAALDFDDVGVRVNAIAPVALTRMTASAIGRIVKPDGSSVALLAGIDDRAPERVAPLVTFLLSDAAAGITGQFVRFDGQRLALLPQPDLAAAPGIVRDGWTSAEIQEAFGGELREHLQPYGVQRRQPAASTQPYPPASRRRPPAPPRLSAAT